MHQQAEVESPAPSFLLTERGQNFCAGLLLAGVLVFLGISFSPVVERFNNIFTDFQIDLLPKQNLSNLPVIVEVDEKSLATYGQWPWPRYRVAKLLDAIRASSPAAVAVDALFAEQDRTSPAKVLEDLTEDFKHSFPLSSSMQALPDYDEILSEALHKGPFVLSYVFSFDGTSLNPCQPQSATGNWTASKGELTEATRLFKANNLLCNIATLEQGGKYNGFINSTADDDGLYRKTPLIIEYQHRLYPSLALQSFITAAGESQFSVIPENGGLILQIGERAVPLDLAGNLLIKLPDAQHKFNKISAADLLGNTPAKAELKDKIVLLGFSATGLHEFRPTPYMPQFLGVELHAAVIDNLDRQDYLQRPNGTLFLELFSGALLILALMWGLTYAKPLTCSLVPLLLIAGLAIISQIVLDNTGMVISPVPPIAMVLLASLTLALIKYSREHLHANRMAKLVSQTQAGIIESFCAMCEYRDPETAFHIKRTQHYVKALATHLQTHPKFAGILTPDFVDLLYKAAPLHDIGKVGIRDHILLKPGRLADDEFAIMQSHPAIGAEIISSAARQIGWNPFMRIAHDISLSHQEKWDGSGYPSGLRGEDIPLAARFMALADVYDALISKRVYKPAFSHQTALGIIEQTSGTHFDPLLVEAFLQIHEEFQNIALCFLDEAEQKNTLLGIDNP